MDIWTTNNETLIWAIWNSAAFSDHDGNLIFGLSQNSYDQQAI